MCSSCVSRVTAESRKTSALRPHLISGFVQCLLFLFQYSNQIAVPTHPLTQAWPGLWQGPVNGQRPPPTTCLHLATLSPSYLSFQGFIRFQKTNNSHSKAKGNKTMGYLNVRLIAIVLYIYISLTIWKENSSSFAGVHIKHSKIKKLRNTERLLSVHLFQLFLNGIWFSAVFMKCSPFLIVEIEFMYIFIFF